MSKTASLSRSSVENPRERSKVHSPKRKDKFETTTTRQNVNKRNKGLESKNSRP